MYPVAAALRFGFVLFRLPLARPGAGSQGIGFEAVKRMKIHIEMDMTPEEARTLMGLPDVSALNEQMLEEMRRRMKEASDPEALMKLWAPMGQGFEQFQRFLWDSAKAAAAPKKG
jgi:hypothetical protein